MNSCKWIGIAALTFAGTVLFAGPSVNDGGCKVEFDNGKVKIYAQNGKQLAMTVTPNPAMDGVTAKAVSTTRGKTLLLRGAKSSIAFILRAGTLRLSSAYGIRELNINMDAKAIVLPDMLGEDLVVRPNDTRRRIPAFVPYFTVLAGQGDLTVSCVRAAAAKDTFFCKNTFTFPQGNGEDLLFTFFSGKNVWKELNGITKEAKTIDWKPPFPAYWAAAFSTKDGYAVWAYYDMDNKNFNTQVNWASVTYGPPAKNPPTTWISWLGSINYPFYAEKGIVKLCFPSSRGTIKDGDYNGNGVLIYPKDKIKQTPKNYAFPQQYLAVFTPSGIKRSIIFFAPATCGTTQMVEKYFTQEKVKENAKTMHDELDSMDVFQAFVRGRLEQYMRWQEKTATLVAGHKAESVLQPYFTKMKQYYETQLKRMKYPDEVFRESAQMQALIESGEDAEVRENKVKELGRSIRSKGGAQDNTCGFFRTVIKSMRQNLVLYYMNAKPDLKEDFLMESIYKDSGELLNGWIWTEGK